MACQPLPLLFTITVSCGCLSPQGFGGLTSDSLTYNFSLVQTIGFSLLVILLLALSWGLPSVADPSHQRTHYLGSDLRLSGLMDCLMDSTFSHRLSDSLLEQGFPGELRDSISASLPFAESLFALAALLSPPP